MLIESMKKEKQLDQDLSSPTARAAAEISHDWVDQEDESISVDGVEDHWCIVSDDDLQEGEHPKGNNWDHDDDMAAAEVPFANMAERIKKLDFQGHLPPSVKNPKNLLLILHLLVGIIVVLHLAWDRYSWRSSALRLERELYTMAEKTVPPPVIEKEPYDLPENDEKDHVINDHPEYDYLFTDWKKEEPDNVIMDNCWVHARASVSFQECAQDAKETAKEVTQEVVRSAKVFAKHTWKAAKKFKKHAEAAAAAAAARRRNQPY